MANNEYAIYHNWTCHCQFHVSVNCYSSVDEIGKFQNENSSLHRDCNVPLKEIIYQSYQWCTGVFPSWLYLNRNWLIHIILKWLKLEIFDFGCLIKMYSKYIFMFSYLLLWLKNTPVWDSWWLVEVTYWFKVSFLPIINLGNLHDARWNR